MALAITRVNRIVAGNEKCNVVDFTADNSYATGGYTLATTDLVGMTQVPGATTTTVSHITSTQNASGYTVAYDKANSKLMFWLGGTQATTTTSSAVVRARVYFGHVNSK